MKQKYGDEVLIGAFKSERTLQFTMENILFAFTEKTPGDLF